MIRFDERLLGRSSLLRKKVREALLLARDLKIKITLEELLEGGEYYGRAVASLCERFGVAPSTVKRAVRRFPPTRPPARRPARARGRSARLVGGRPVEPRALLRTQVDSDDRV